MNIPNKLLNQKQTNKQEGYANFLLKRIKQQGVESIKHDGALRVECMPYKNNLLRII